MREPCPVEGNCRSGPGSCAFCYLGSEYRPGDPKVRFPLDEELARTRREREKARKASEPYRSGVRSVRKGKRLEREVARLVKGERVPLSGELERYPNDVVASGGWRLEVKGRSSAGGILYRLLEGADVAAVSDGEWLFACRLSLALPALRDGAAPGNGRDLLRLAEGVLEGHVLLPWGGRMAVRRVRRGLSVLRSWLVAEKADALCLKADRKEWLFVCDAAHMRAALAHAPGRDRIDMTDLREA